MSSSRLLAATVPGGLLSSMTGLLTANQTLVVQAITSGTYFVFNEVPSGTPNGVNAAFVLANTPKPTASVEVYVNGKYQVSGASNDYTFAAATITFTTGSIPQSGDTILCNYTVSPV